MNVDQSEGFVIQPNGIGRWDPRERSDVQLTCWKLGVVQGCKP